MDIRLIHLKIAQGSYDMNLSIIDPSSLEDRKELIRKRQEYIQAKEALHHEFKEDCIGMAESIGFDRPIAERLFQNAYDAANPMGHDAVVHVFEDLITNFG